MMADHTLCCTLKICQKNVAGELTYTKTKVQYHPEKPLLEITVSIFLRA